MSSVAATGGTTHIQASVPTTELTIFGFTSPYSRVELFNSKLFDVTYSKANGYFQFDRTVVPKNTGEICLLAVDASDRHSSPICLPPPPPINHLTHIGPIVLPPTLTIDQHTNQNHSLISASGQTIPFSPVSIYLYQTTNTHQLVKPAAAFGLPLFTTTSDSTGNYSLSLPDNYVSDYRLFSTITFSGLLSPKSNTITYQVETKPNLIFFVIAGVVLLLILVISRQRPRQSRRYLPAVFKYPLAIYSPKRI